ncbi:MAG: patatin-like phospholipase family protein, partial [Spirochaetota bacterium]|nr:patatin-like phospholipase family protein [Spirochaetota bacterium]
MALFSLCSLPLVRADSLLMQDIPIFYGEERFLDRIESLPSSRSEPLGLLLSGGSARAFAHIGVLRALDERGLSPDFIVTNSMGSIVGMLYAAGLAPDDILKLIERIELSTLFEPELPARGGILNPSIFTELAKEVIIEDDIRNFPVPLIVVCEDLKTKRTILLAEGEVGAVLAASFALPVYFRPVELFGHSLIDGGLSNIAPVGIPHIFTDQVIASTTFYKKELDLDNPLTILNVAMDITKARAGVKELKEYKPVWIRCDVETFSFMNWSAMDEIVQRGYASACEELDRGESREKLEAGSRGHLDAVHSEARLRAQRACREYERSGTVYFDSLEWGLKAGVMADGGPQSRTLLQERNRFSAGPYLTKGYAHLNLDGFYQPQWLNQFQSIEDN